MSVPYRLDGSTIEHFPVLGSWELLNKSGVYTLRNTDSDGVVTEFGNLKFHGGPGSTLEMREFALPDLMNEVERAGFTDVRVHAEDEPEFGVINQRRDSLVLSAVKPG